MKNLELALLHWTNTVIICIATSMGSQDSFVLEDQHVITEIEKQLAEALKTITINSNLIELILRSVKVDVVIHLNTTTFKTVSDMNEAVLIDWRLASLCTYL